MARCASQELMKMVRNGGTPAAPLVFSILEEQENTAEPAALQQFSYERGQWLRYCVLL